MNLSDKPPEFQQRYLLELIKSDLHAKLVDEAIASIRPSIHKAVHEVMAELQPAVETHYDALRNQLAVVLLHKEIK